VRLTVTIELCECLCCLSKAGYSLAVLCMWARVEKRFNLMPNSLGFIAFWRFLVKPGFLRAKAECFARLCRRLGVCPSVCPSVCHTRDLYQNGAS